MVLGCLYGLLWRIHHWFGTRKNVRRTHWCYCFRETWRKSHSRSENVTSYFLKKKLSLKNYLFIYLAALGLSRDMWDLVPQPGIKPRPPALGGRHLSHWTIREVPFLLLTIFVLWSLAWSGRSQKDCIDSVIRQKVIVKKSCHLTKVATPYKIYLFFWLCWLLVTPWPFLSLLGSRGSRVCRLQ